MNGKVTSFLRRTAISLVLALPLVGCGELEPDGVACIAIAIAGLDVAVVNESTNQPVCDATVTATDGGYSERLNAIGCRYSGAFERPGSYSLRAERAGFATRTVVAERVAMSSGQCPHPVAVRTEIRLTPTP